MLTLVLYIQIKVSNSLDTEIQSMRREGIEKYDISIYVEEKVEYIHSRIALRPLITGIEHATKLSVSFENRANTTFGRILNGRVRRKVKRLETKLARLYNGRGRKSAKRKRSIEIIGNLISKLFGNPGPEDWKQNTRNILAMKEAIERQVANSVAQHHDVDQNRHAINEQNEILKQTTRAVMSNENRLNNIDNELAELETYFELESMIESIDEIIEALIDINRDAKTAWMPLDRQMDTRSSIAPGFSKKIGRSEECKEMNTLNSQSHL